MDAEYAEDAAAIEDPVEDLIEDAAEARWQDAEQMEQAEAQSAQAGADLSNEPGHSGESAQSAMVVPELEPTGQVEVDAALERLRVLAERPTRAHPDLYDGVHQRLQEVLAQIDHQDAGR